MKKQFRGILKSILVLATVPFFSSEAFAYKEIKSESTAALVAQQNQIVEGIVTGSDNGLPLPGVSIVVKGTKSGTTTDFDGKFILKANPDDVLVFTYVGFLKQEIKVGNKRNINVVMKVDTSELDEVTVVAYGTQKKESVVASISTVKPEELRIPSSNLTASFSGRVPGLISFQTSGEPGADNAEFFIRGVTTFGFATSPLILVDGIESTKDDLARLDVDDIESFSIMKDASAAALYGSRGGNGVILVNTKQGKEGKAVVSAKYEQFFSSNVKDVRYASPVTYMDLWNEAAFTNRTDGSIINQDIFTQNQIDNVINRVNPYAAPATDWYDLLFKDYALNKRLGINVSGGGKVAKYYLSATYTKDSGILSVDERSDFNSGIDLNKLQVRSNNSINITPSLEAQVQIYLALDDYSGPLDGAQDIFNKVRQTSPSLYPAFYEPDAANAQATQILFGNLGDGANYINPYAESIKGYREYTRSKFSTQVNLSQKINEDLSVRTKLGYDVNSLLEVRREYDPFYYNIDFYDKFTNTYTLQWLNEDQNPEDAIDFDRSTNTVQPVFYGELALNFSKELNEKNIVGAVLVGTAREEKSNANGLQESLARRNLSLAGRLTYSYDSKYFTEFNFGYNGSERFSEDERWGFFPSFGAGWTVSKESFFVPITSVVNRLRLRGSYGLVGNDNIGSASDRFFYLSNISLNDGNRSATFGEEFGNTINGVSISRYANSSITWTTSNKLNLAMDLGMFDNQIDLTVEYFSDKTNNIFLKRPEIPDSFGIGVDLFANSGKAKSQGFEFSLKMRRQFNKNLYVSALSNFTYATSEYVKFDEPDYSEIPWRSRIGQSLRQSFGYVAERLFYDEFDVANSPEQFGLQQNTYNGYGQGDIKYKDINEDGKIDEGDLVPIGYPTTPEINYGFGMNVQYKNWDLGFFFNGIARKTFFINSATTAPFYQFQAEGRTAVNQLLDVYAQNHWSEENRDPYALYPRLTHAFNENNRKSSTWWMRDGSYLRLQQIEIGYTIPKNFIKTAMPFIQSSRLYLSGRNLLTISKFDLWDVSLSGNPYNYPVQKVVNFGFRVKF